MFLLNPFMVAPSVTYTTLNSADKAAGLTLSGGDLTVDHDNDGDAHRMVRSIAAKSAGKWYCEFTQTGTPTACVYGVAKATANINSYVGADANGYGYNGAPVGAGGILYHSGGDINPYGSASGIGSGNVLSILLDLDAGTLDLWDAGVPISPTVTGLSGTFHAAVSLYGTAEQVVANFGATAFTHAPPAGYSGWTA